MERGYGGLTTVSGWEPPIVNHGSGLQPVASALVPGGIMALPSFTELGQCKTYILFYSGGSHAVPKTYEYCAV